MKKKIILFATAMGISFLTEAQIINNIGNRIEQKAIDRANRKIDEKIDKGLDKIENGIDGNLNDGESGNNKSNSSNQEGNNQRENSQRENNNKTAETATSNQQDKASMKVDSRFDFVAGDKVVLFEDFSKDNIGDFPDKWNTNGSGEITTNNMTSGKYLKTTNSVIFYPEWLKTLPDNFTAEFDLITTNDYSFYSGAFSVGLTSEKNLGTKWDDYSKYGDGADISDLAVISFHPHDVTSEKGTSVFKSYHNKTRIIENTADQTQFHVYNKNMAHISIWRQKQRIRVYINDIKVWDLPRALDAGAVLNTIYFANNGVGNDGEAYFMSNLRVAVGAPDTRNKLITEGKFSTSGILFDTGSDKIKIESYGILKEIASVLKENESVNIKIVGHTDSDGDDAANIVLSKKRATAVKNILTKDFGIKESRMQADGKGEAEPMQQNNSAENKAQNRRVEFIKL